MKQKMIWLTLLAAGLATGGAGSAQASDVRVGLGLEATTVNATDANGYGFVPSVSLSGTWHNPRRDFRAKLSVSSYLLPFARLDATWLSQNDLYFGAGVGTGLGAAGSLTALTPFVLANVHAVVGKNFGPLQVEAQARVGVLNSIGLNVSYLIGR